MRFLRELLKKILRGISITIFEGVPGSISDGTAKAISENHFVGISAGIPERMFYEIFGGTLGIIFQNLF